MIISTLNNYIQSLKKIPYYMEFLRHAMYVIDRKSVV